MPRQQADFKMDSRDESVEETDLELARLVPGPPSVDGTAVVQPPNQLPHTPAPPDKPLVKTGRTPQTRSGAKESWMWDESELSKIRLRQLFTMIDRFEVEAAESGSGKAVSTGDGGISSTELMHMLVNLGEDVSENMADEMVNLVDIDQSTQIEFEEFYGVLTGCISLDKKKGCKQTQGGGGRSIREIRHQFNMVDDDGGGSLDKDEIAGLAEKMGQALKKRHLLDAMRAMDPTDTGEVDFESFKNWLIDTKEGRHWSDFLVLPEGCVVAVRRRAIDEGLLPEQAGAAAEWQRLSVLLKVLWETVDVWGSPVDLYGLTLGEAKSGKADAGAVLTPEEIELEAMAMANFFHPNMPIRTAWDLVQVILLLYLLIMVPMRIAFGLEVAFGTSAFWFDAFVDVYFIVDIFMNFKTGYYDARGVLVIDSGKIANNYFRSWFVLDFITCLPVNYVMMLIAWDTDSSNAGKEVKAFKILRLLKLGKLLRVARIIRIVDRYQEELRVFMDAFGGIILSVLVFLLCHIIACLWFYVGSFDDAPNGALGQPGYDGWVTRYFYNGGLTCEESAAAAAADLENRTAAEVFPANCDDGEASQVTKYITSAYWAMMTISTVGYGDVSVTTDREKVVALMTMLFGALVFAAITGSLSARFMATMGAEQDFNTRMDEVRQYLRDNSVPTQQRRSIEAHFQLLWGKTAIYDETEIMSLLPRVLGDPIVHSRYTPIISHSALFAKLSDGSLPQGHEVLALVARCLTHTVAGAGLMVMRQGDYGSEMFFIADGEVDVYRTQGETTYTEAITYHSDVRAQLGLRLGRLGVDSYFGEQAVMSRGNGMRRGIRIRSVMSRTPCQFHVLSKEGLDNLREEIPLLNGVIASVEDYGSGSAATKQLTDGSGADTGQLAGEVKALSTKLDKALNAIAELSVVVQRQQQTVVTVVSNQEDKGVVLV